LALSSTLGGILAYAYLVLDLPGAESIVNKYGWAGLLGAVFIGVMVGFGFSYLLNRIANEPA
jgi:hypothetical protein